MTVKSISETIPASWVFFFVFVFQWSSFLFLLSSIFSLQTRHDDLEKKVQELEDRLKILDDPPSSKFIIEEAKQPHQDERSTQSTLSSMWQLMKINKRLQATEDAVERIMAILHEFLGTDGKAISGLKSDMEDVANELKNLKESLFGAENDSRQRWMGGDNDAASRLSSLEEHLNKLVKKDELALYVKWPALEEALNVKRTDLERRHKDKTRTNVLNLENETHGSSVLEVKEDKEVDNKGNIESDTESDGRAQTAPLPSSLGTPIPMLDYPKTAFTQSTQVRMQLLHFFNETPCW